MLETINLSTFEIKANYILIKPDKNFDVLEVDGPEGKKIELKIVSFGEKEANHYSITGTVIKKPKQTYFFADRTVRMSQAEFASRMDASLQVNCDYPFNEGDRVYYNYSAHLSAEEEYRLVETEEYGICMLIKLDSLFGYEADDKIIPVNGNVFFERDKADDEYVTDSGLTVIQNVTGYDKNHATIVAISAPVKSYVDGGCAGDLGLKVGDRVIVDKRFGYKMAYDLHAGDIKDVEVCLQKYILAVLEEA